MPEVQTAIILAAGVGVRLKDRGRQTPKGCLHLGEHSIIEESIMRLLDVGIQQVVIVTGHLAEQFEFLPKRYGSAVQLIHNPHFADSGSMYSLYCARNFVKDAFLLLESDIVYESRALTTCLGSACANVVLLSRLSDTSDEVFVETRDGRLVGMSKIREQLGPEVIGELVGISKISRSLFTHMIAAATLRFQSTRHMDYETECLVAVAPLEFVSCPVMEDLAWCEIDDESHLFRAKTQIYPAVREIDLRDRLMIPGRHVSPLT